MGWSTMRMREFHRSPDLTPFPPSPQLLPSATWCTPGAGNDCQVCYCNCDVMKDYHISCWCWIERILGGQTAYVACVQVALQRCRECKIQCYADHLSQCPDGTQCYP